MRRVIIGDRSIYEAKLKKALELLGRFRDLEQEWHKFNVCAEVSGAILEREIGNLFGSLTLHKWQPPKQKRRAR